MSDWSRVHEERSTGGAIVRVSRREGRRQYSIQVGKEWRESDGSIAAERLSMNVPVYINGATPDRSVLEAVARALDFIETDAPTQPSGRGPPASNGHARDHHTAAAPPTDSLVTPEPRADRKPRRSPDDRKRYSRYEDDED